VKISQSYSCLYFCYAIRGISWYFMIRVFSSHLFNTCRKLNFLLMLSQASSSSLTDTLQHQLVQNYLIMSLSDFLLQSSLRFFVCGIVSPAVRILFSAGLVLLVYFRSFTYTGLLWYNLTLCICSDHFGYNLHISAKIRSGIPYDRL
jgi:hypothetical protein